MKKEPQINLAVTYDINLDISISRLVHNGHIDLLSTVQLLLSQQCPNSEVRHCMG